jgi:Fur family transcriptional regulator, peroxide stress response regulator
MRVRDPQRPDLPRGLQQTDLDNEVKGTYLNRNHSYYGWLVTGNRTKERILDALRNKGVKLTPQRVEIIDVLSRDGGHPSAGAILKKARERVPELSSSTVYYTLVLLKKEGLVKELEFYDMENRYDTVVKDHVDLVCEECGSIENLEEEIPFDRGTIEKSTGFLPARTRFEYYGRCRKCREKDR